MLHIESNIPPNIFYSAIKVDFFINQSTLCLGHYIPKVNELLKGKKQPGSKRVNTSTSLSKIMLLIQRVSDMFSKYNLYDVYLSMYMYVPVYVYHPVSI